MAKIAIYAGEGTAESFLPVWEYRFRQIFGRRADIRFIGAEDIPAISEDGTHMLIMPGGHERYYQQALEPEGNQAIINFVLNGGVYTGVCGGAYYACSQIDFTGKGGLRIQTPRSLRFFSGTAAGSIPEYGSGEYYDDEPITASAVETAWNIAGADSWNGWQYYHGGCHFIPDEGEEHQYQIAAMYPDARRIAAVMGNKGKGMFFLSGVHIEVDFYAYKRFLYPRYGMQTEAVIKQYRSMERLSTESFHILMRKLLPHSA